MQVPTRLAPTVEVINRSRHLFETAKPGDVGHDLFADIEPQSWLDRLVSFVVGRPALIIWPFSMASIGSRIFVSMPDTVWCEIKARSSTMRKKMMVLGGVIDSGYQGELFTILHNFGLMPRIVKDGERYAQVVFTKALRPDLVEVEEFIPSERGDSGFGSTGR